MTKNLKYLFGALFLSVTFWWGFNVFQNGFNNFLTAQISAPLQNQVAPPPEKQRPVLNLDAKAALALEINQEGKQTILFEKNAQTPLPIASITKLMTALVIFENPQTFDFQKVVTISKEAADQGDTPNFGNLKAGEKYTLGELVRIMLVFSSNDSAYALAQIPGVDKFTEMMNQEAARLGMQYTYFQNANGLEPKGVNNPALADLNYSTAGDLAKLDEYILNNHPEIFETTLEAKNFPSIEYGLADLKFTETNEAIGIKTGYTNSSSGCLTILFKDKNGNRFINIILGTPTEETRISEMQKLIDWINI